jgi:DNA-directed RNA polymerase beta subunit
MSLPSDRSGRLLQEVLRYQGVGRSVILSYNDFVQHEIPRIVASRQVNTYHGDAIRFSNPKLFRPAKLVGGKSVPLLPREVRGREGHYLGELYVNITMTKKDVKETETIESSCGKLPIMAKSEWDNFVHLSEDEKKVAGEASLDPGGYFLIKGAEKVLVAQENLRTKIPIIYFDQKREVEVVRYTGDSSTETSVVQGWEDKSKSIILFTTSKLDNLKKSVNIFILFFILYYPSLVREKVGSRVEESAKRAMRRILELITGPNYKERRKRVEYYLLPSQSVFLSLNEEEIFAEIRDKVSERDKKDRDIEIVTTIIRDIFKNVVVGGEGKQPMGVIATKEIRAKISNLADMIGQYAEVRTGSREPDSRDNWVNKRVINSGRHVKNFFAKAWKNLLDALSVELDKRKSVLPLVEIQRIFARLAEDNITTEFVRAFSSENWSGQKNNQKVANIVDVLHRENIIYHLYQLNTVTTQVSRQVTKKDIRLLRPDQWGYICFITTPEGRACGLVRNLSITTWVTVNRDPTEISKIIEPRLENRSDERHPDPVILGGVVLGFGNGSDLRAYLVALRRERRIPYDTAITQDQNGRLIISCDAERLIRPLLVVDKEKAILAIDEKNLRSAPMDALLRNGVIEYIDIREQQYLYVAESEQAFDDVRTAKSLAKDRLKNLRSEYDQLKFETKEGKREERELKGEEKKKLDCLAQQIIISEQDYQKIQIPDYCEIDPQALIGVSPGIIPFIAFNQGPRIAFQGAMGKQSLTVDSSRNDLSFYDDVKLLEYADIGIVNTDLYKAIGLERYPRTQTVIVAYDLGGGAAQEDAVILNQGSVDRGLFRTYIIATVKTYIQNTNDFREEMRIPEGLSFEKSKEYRNLHQDEKNPYYGIVKIGTYVREDDILVAKILTMESSKEIKIMPVRVPVNKEGWVDDISVVDTIEGKRAIRIRLVQIKAPEVGDKGAMMPSQKGTYGEIKAEVDMPYVISHDKRFDGIRPDVIFNPLGFPKRMTVGKLLEIASGNLGLVTGTRINASAFRSINIATLRKDLADNGFTDEGMFSMIDGETGVKKKVKIFLGPIQDQVLRHLSSRKMHARGTGPRELLTRQPRRGVRQRGGVRFGEMERDNLISFGAPQLLRERLMFSSDRYEIKYCVRCGSIASVKENRIRCNTPDCEESGIVSTVVPYSFILLSRYLSAASIKFTYRPKQ